MTITWPDSSHRPHLITNSNNEGISNSFSSNSISVRSLVLTLDIATIPVESEYRSFLNFSARTGVSAFSAVAPSSTSIKNVAVPGLKNGMDYVKLGDSDLEVSKVCMGTMTFGEVSVDICF